MLQLIVPIMLGMLSLCLGQDDNWDLKNYHLYNPFALLNGKIGFDLAPAQWQSYFNPTLDLLYYGLTKTMPAPFAGFLMGVLHGLNFLLVLAIARLAIPTGATGIRIGTPTMLALAAIASPGFLAQIGNSMGDNMTSLFVLGSLSLVLRQVPSSITGPAPSVIGITVAGLLMGLGCGLKLTNGTYALALCAALLVVPGAISLRLYLAFTFGIGVLIGIGISAGYWFALMYQTFGNPLFPQLNNHFMAPLAAQIGIGDTGWLPKNWSEKLLWPFIFAIEPRRVSELTLRLWMWPLLYLGMLTLGAKALLAARTRVPSGATSTPLYRQRLVLAFFVLAYLIWLNLFGIYRYMIALELLMPLVVWLLAERLLPSRWSKQAAVAVIIMGAIACLPRVSWGHANWTRVAFDADIPLFDNPRQSMVFTVHGDPPLGWLATRFPAELAFVSIGSGFPESPAYSAKLRQMAALRKGPLFALMQGDRADPAAPRTAADMLRAREADRLVVERASELVNQYGMALNPTSCKLYQARVGTNRWNYQLCMLKLR
jgi:hypothetical protein